MCSKRRFCSTPPAKRWGGVGGGGCVNRLDLSMNSRTCGATPHPRPRERALLASDSTTRGARGRRGEGRQLHQRRQEPRQRLAGAGRRDQECRAIFTGLSEQIKLMFARRPATACEPSTKTVRQQFGRMVRRSGKDAGRHGSRPKPLRRLRRGRRGYFTSPDTCVRGATPHPRPLPTASREEGSRACQLHVNRTHFA
jgi:hypothetical protein